MSGSHITCATAASVLHPLWRSQPSHSASNMEVAHPESSGLDDE